MTPPAGDIRRHPLLPAADPTRGGRWHGLAQAAATVLIGRRADPLAGLAEEQSARIRAAQVAGVVRFTPLTMSVNLLNTAIVVLAFWDSAPRWALGAWSVVIALLAGVALRRWRVGQRRPPREAVSRRATSRTVAHGAALAAAWGVAPAVLFPMADPFERFVLGCLATGMIAGGAFALSGVPRAGLAYSWILCLLTAAGMASVGNAAMAAAAVVLCFYATIISRNLVTQGDLFASNLRARSEIEAQGEVLGLLLRDFEESAGDCLWETDAAGRLRRCSPRLAWMLGLDPEAAAGASLPELLNRGAAAGSGGDPAAAFAAPVAFRDLLARVAAPGGEERALSLTAKPILNSAGAFAGFRGVASDVTERERAKAALLAQNERFDAAIANMSQGLCMFDADTRLVVHNERAVKLFASRWTRCGWAGPTARSWSASPNSVCTRPAPPRTRSARTSARRARTTGRPASSTAKWRTAARWPAPPGRWRGAAMWRPSRT